MTGYKLYDGSYEADPCPVCDQPGSLVGYDDGTSAPTIGEYELESVVEVRMCPTAGYEDYPDVYVHLYEPSFRLRLTLGKGSHRHAYHREFEIVETRRVRQ